MVIDQPLVISGNDSVTFENLDITVRAPITVMDNATLTIHNSRMTWDQTYHQEYWTTFQDNAHLVVDGLAVRSNHYYWYNWNYEGNADISIKNLSRDLLWTGMTDHVNYSADNSDIGLTVYGWDDSMGNSVSVTNSLVYFELIPVAGVYDFSLPREGPIDYWKAGFLGNVSATNSDIYKIDFDIVNDTHITIRDSKDVSVGWILNYNDNSTYETNGVQNRHYDDQAWTVGDSSLRIVNTDIASFWPLSYGNFTWNVSDSTMVDVRAYDNTIRTFTNCTFFSISGYQNANITLLDSYVENNAMATGMSTVNLNQVTDNNGEFFYTVLDQGKIFRDGTAITQSTSAQ